MSRRGLENTYPARGAGEKVSTLFAAPPREPGEVQHLNPRGYSRDLKELAPVTSLKSLNVLKQAAGKLDRLFEQA